MNAKKSKKGKALHRGKKLAAKKPLSSGKYLEFNLGAPTISS
jgi:hypothetical protein